MIAHAAVGATLALLFATAAAARPTYTAFQGKNIVVQGRGDGGAQTARGIDWWVSGEPARKFQRIGTIRDVRIDNDRPDDVVGALDIAKLVTAKGGNAVIVLEQRKITVPGSPTFNLIGGQSYGQSVTFGPALDAFDITLAVIKYVEQ